MQITRFRLKNVGLHRDLDWDTTGGVVGITGKNGRGKSTVMLALEFVWRGLLKESPIRKEDMITWGETNSWVEVHFQVGGNVGRLRRYFSSAKRELEWGGETFTKDDEVNECLRRILGVDLDSFRSASFVRQGELRGALFGTDSNRRDILARLLNVGSLGPRLQQLDRSIKSYKDKNIDDTVYGRRDTEEEKVRDAKAHIARIEKELADSLYDEPQFLKLVQSNTLQSRLEEESSNLAMARTKLEQTDGAIVALYEGLVTGVEDLTRSLETHQTALGTLQETRRRLGAAETLEKELEGLRASISTLQEERKDLVETLTAALGKADSAAGWATLLEEKGKELENRLTLRNLLENKEGTEAQLKAAEAELKVLLQENLEDPQPIFEKATTLRNTAKLLETSLSVLESSDGCTGDKVTCSRCNLNVIPKEMISPEHIGEMRELILQHGRDADEADRKGKDLKEQIALRDRKRHRLEGVVADKEGQLQKVATSLAALPKDLKPIDTEEAEKETARNQSLKELIGTLKEKETFLRVFEGSEAQKSRELKAIDLKGIDPKAVLAEYESKYAETEKIREERDSKATTRDALHPGYLRFKDLRDTVERLEGETVPELREKLRELKEDPEFLAIFKRLGTTEPDRAYALMVEAKTASEGLAGELRMARSSLATSELNLLGIGKAIERQKMHHKVLERLTVLRSILAPEGVVKTFILHKFKGVTPRVSKVLSQLGAPFMIRGEEGELNYQFMRMDRPDSPWLDMKMMSGAQKAMLSLAFLTAVQQSICKTTNFLALDEPSTHMDNDAVAALSDMLSKLGNSSSLTGGQCWVVDHHDTIKGGLTKNFEIEKNE